MNTTVKNAVYMSMFGTSLCLTACGKTNNRDENNSNKDSVSTTQPIETEMDSVVSSDTIMPAP
ncbi:hypothetical protein AMR72_06655 [Flavobacterium psychrophilum]|nr:hypothetical protein AMR72_06655 [Flavobacterium psychrophilum]AOE52216.1 hypothetical protein ALW18_06645 [Flavobacterium psychrophilum]